MGFQQGPQVPQVTLQPQPQVTLQPQPQTVVLQTPTTQTVQQTQPQFQQSSQPQSQEMSQILELLQKVTKQVDVLTGRVDSLSNKNVLSWTPRQGA